jgi:molecular chaperone GrpE
MTDSHHREAAPAAGHGGRQRHLPTPSERAEEAQPFPPVAAEDAPAGEAVTDPVVELVTLRAELDEKSQQYLRLAADFENYRRRSVQEWSDRARQAGEQAVLVVLPVLDNLRRAVEHANGAGGSLLEGVQMTLRQFEEALASLGVSEIPTVGQPFDPAIHEAVLGEESPDVDSDVVTAEIERGYRLGDRVLRPARVKVAHPARAPRAQPPPES